MVKTQAATTRNPRVGARTSAPVELMQGYDSVSGVGLSIALAGKSHDDGGVSDMRYQVCEDISSLAEALEINQSLSVGFGPVGGIDEKMKFVRNLNVTAHSISIVVYAKHTVGIKTATNVALAPGVTLPVGNEALAEFFLGYGDSYLSSCTRGGEYYAVYTFYSQTREEKNQLEVDMKAQGLFDVAKVDAGLQVKINNFTSSSRTRVTFEQHITGIRNPKLPPADKIIDFAREFPSLEPDAPTVIRFETTGYERVPGFRSFQPIARTRKFFVGTGIVDGLTASLVRVKQLQNQIRLLQDIYAVYGGYEDTRLRDVAKQAGTDLRTINALIEDYEDDPTRSFTAPTLPSLDAGTPALDFAIRELKAFGQDGTAFNDVDIGTALARQTRIVSLRMASGAVVENLEVVYQDTTGPRTFGHGKGGAGFGDKLDLAPGQFVTAVSGRSGTQVDRLQIESSNKGSIAAGGNGGGDFSWTADKDEVVLGFAGRVGKDYLGQIRVVYAKRQPAKWIK